MKKSVNKLKNSISYLVIISAVLACLSLSVTAQSKKSKSKKDSNTESVANTQSPDVVLQVGKLGVTFEEIEKSYKKNFNRKNLSLKDLSKDSLYDFINLYAKYKLKVLDAEERGLDKDSAVKAEIDNYCRVVAESFYFDKYLTEPKVEELTKKRNVELKIGIILCSVTSGPKRDTVSAYEKAKSALQRLKAGEDFATVAKEMSDDKYSSSEGGELPTYITAGRLNRDIEDVAYKLKPGEFYPQIVSIPKFGYFLIKNVKTEPRFKVKLSHILISKNTNTGTDSLTKVKDSITVAARIDSVYSMLKQGADFRSLAVKFSDDPGSSQKGGAYEEWYSRSTGFDKSGGGLVPEFEKAVFDLKDGEMSGIVKTMYGYHIVRRDSTKKIDLSEERDDVKKMYKKLYFDQDRRTMLNQLRIRFGFQLNNDAFNTLMSSLDTTVTTLDTLWTFRISNKLKATTFYTYDNKTVTVGDFVDAATKPGELRGIPLNPEGLNRAINIMTDNTTIELATKDLEKENSDYVDLIREFRDGSLVFKLDNIEIWNNMKFDSTFAKSYYDSTKSKYNTLPDYDISEIYVINKTQADDIYNKLKDNKMSFDSAASLFTQRAGFREMKGKWFKLNPSKHALAKIAESIGMKTGDISTPQKFEDGYSIIKLNDFTPSRQKTFEEAIPDFAPAMQDAVQKRLTEKWLEKVKKKYPIKINDNKIKELTNK